MLYRCHSASRTNAYICVCVCISFILFHRSYCLSKCSAYEFTSTLKPLLKQIVKLAWILIPLRCVRTYTSTFIHLYTYASFLCLTYFVYQTFTFHSIFRTFRMAFKLKETKRNENRAEEKWRKESNRAVCACGCGCGCLSV